MAFSIFCLVYIPMCAVIGVAAAAISASAWPFVVPLLLSFDVFEDFENVFDTVILSIAIDLSNAALLCFLYNRKKLVKWQPATVLGAAAAGPAIAMAFLAQAVLLKLESLLKNLSGYGLFLFAGIFIFKGFKLRGQRPHGGQQNASNTETGEVAQLTRRDTAAGTESVGDTTSPQTSGPVCSMIFHLGPGGTAIQTSYLALVLGVSAMCGALAGFIGFGNGLLFATMLIVGLGHEVADGTATACASTFFLMAAVLAVFLHQLRPELIKYVAVACISSACGSIAGSIFALRLDPVKIHFFVGITLVVSGVLAVVPTLLPQ